MRKSLFPIGALVLLPISLIASHSNDRGPAYSAPDAAVFIAWINDDHWLAARNGNLRLVEALSGAERAVDDLDRLMVNQPAFDWADRAALAQKAAEVVASQKAGDLGEFAF